MDTGERWRLGHRPALDGLRGVAIVLVLVCHLAVPGMAAAGAVGVTIFFTLSGFLITSLLLEEHGRMGRVNLRAFYIRRARRLLPALVVCVVVVTSVGAVALGPGFASVPGGALALLYMSNWVEMANLNLNALGHTWSLSVEEQFYVAWPLVLLVAARWGRRGISLAASAGIVGALVVRLLAWDGQSDGIRRVYFGTDVHADALLLGCLLAVAMGCLRDGRSRPVVAGVLLAACAPLCFAVGSGKWMLVPAVVPVLTAGMIFCVARGKGAHWLTVRPLSWLGKRSYGLYLWHYPVVVAVGMLLPGWAWYMQAAVIVPCALALTALSWRYVERPFLSGHQAPHAAESGGRRGEPRGVVVGVGAGV